MMDCNCHHCLFKRKGKSSCLHCTLSWRKDGYTSALVILNSKLGIHVAKLVIEYLKFRNSCTSNCPFKVPRQACPGCRKALTVRTTRRVKIRYADLLLFTPCERKYKWAEAIRSTHSDKKLCRKCYRYEKVENQYEQKQIPTGHLYWNYNWHNIVNDVDPEWYNDFGCYGWYMGNGKWTHTLELLK